MTVEAHRIIDLLGLSGGQLAVVGGCSRAAAHNWRKGVSAPDQDRQIALEKRWPELHRGTWAMAPQWETESRPDIVNEPETDHGDAHSPLGFVDAHASAKGHLADVQRMIGEARRSQRTVDLMRLMDLERKAIVDLAKFSGELTATEESRLTRTQRWKEICGTIVKALTPHPEAARAVIGALEAISR